MSSDRRGLLRLGAREIGAQFCGIERALLFDERFENVGWAHFLSSDAIVLRRSKFSELDRGITYILPPDIVRKVGEGDLVTIAGRAERKIGKDPETKRGVSFISRKYILVEDVREARLPAIPPVLPKDEFLDRASASWKDAESDMLDWIIALQLVSAPPSVYGKGGIGSEGLEAFRDRGSGTPLDLASTILDQLPVEFRTGSSIYRFEALDNIASLRSYKRVKASEANFSIVNPHRVTDTWVREKPPIQLPFVLRDSRLMGVRTEPDLDVLDYQLTALYSSQPDPDDLLPMATQAIKKAHASELFDFPSFIEVDPLTGVRVALSLMRLNVGREFKGTKYIRRPLASGEGMNVLDELLRRGLEEVRRKAQNEEMFRMDRSLPFRDRLTQNDRELYSSIRRMVEEEGLKEIPLGRILPARGRSAVESSIANLNRYGYLLLMKGGTVLRIVDLDSI